MVEAQAVERNWCEELVYEAAVVHRPSTVAEVQELVAAADKVKALGTRHSFSRIADSPGGALIDMTAVMDDGPVADVDHDAMTAVVPGGVSYGVVVDALEAEGVALPNLASLPHVSIAGATATATHGSGDTNQVLSADVCGLELIAADGTLVSLGRDHADLAALAVGLGAFGMVTALTLEVEPSFQVQQDVYNKPPWQTFLDNLDEIMAGAYSVNVGGRFCPDELNSFWVKSRLEPADDGSVAPIERPQEWFGGTLYDANVIRSAAQTPLGAPGPWSERLAHFLLDAPPSVGGDELQSEYFVARQDAADALQALRLIGDQIDPHLHGFELRTVAADELWMSPVYGRDTFSIGFTWKKHPAGVRAVLPAIEEALRPFEPRPHMGKLSAMGRADLVQRFERLDDFLELVDTYDPSGKFSNPYLNALRP